MSYRRKRNQINIKKCKKKQRINFVDNLKNNHCQKLAHENAKTRERERKMD